MKTLSKKTKTILAVVSGVLMLTAVVGTTLALLKTKSQPVTNNFAGSVVNIGILENDKNLYENPKSGITFTKDVSSAPVDKKVQVKNIDSSDLPTGDTFVRVRLIPVIRYDSDAASHAGEIAPVTIDYGKLTYEMSNSGFWLASGEGIDTDYYYKEALAPDTLTKSLIDSVKYTGEIPEDAHFELQILAEGISALQDGAVADAWKDVAVGTGGVLEKK